MFHLNRLTWRENGATTLSSGGGGDIFDFHSSERRFPPLRVDDDEGVCRHLRQWPSGVVQKFKGLITSVGKDGVHFEVVDMMHCTKSYPCVDVSLIAFVTRISESLTNDL